MRVQIGDRFGKIIAELLPDVAPLSWILNDIGKTALTLARTDAQATAENLQVGNRVYIDFENGLPPWGGVLDLPRCWSAGTVSVTCYDITQLLKYRCTEKNDSFYGRPVGVIFQELLQREEAQDPLGIVLGAVWLGGHPHWPRYHYKSLWYVLDYSLRRMEKCDFQFTPYVENGYIKFRADLFQAAGADKTAAVALAEGANIEPLIMEEQGAVLNSYFAVAEGATWGAERLVVAARARESIAKYGLREMGQVQPGVSVQATLEMHARNRLDENHEPHKIFSLAATNNEPGLFAAYNLGDSVSCVLPTLGFGGYDGPVRILAREYNPASGKCELVIEETFTIEPWLYQVEIDE